MTGAWVPNVFRYVRDSIKCDARNYGYMNAQGTCRDQCRQEDGEGEQGVRIRSVKETPKTKQAILRALNKQGKIKELFNLFILFIFPKGPVVVTMNIPDGFHVYGVGVFDCTKTTLTNTLHAVTIVGYSLKDNYWIVR